MGPRCPWSEVTDRRDDRQPQLSVTLLFLAKDDFNLQPAAANVSGTTGDKLRTQSQKNVSVAFASHRAEVRSNLRFYHQMPANSPGSGDLTAIFVEVSGQSTS